MFLPKQPDEPGKDMRLWGEKGMKQRSERHDWTRTPTIVTWRFVAMVVKDRKAPLSLRSSLNMKDDCFIGFDFYGAVGGGGVN